MNDMKTSPWKAPAKYQIFNMLKAMGVVYLVLVLVHIAIFVLVSTLEGSGEAFSVSMNASSEMAELIFSFVMGCCMWRDGFHLGMAAGVPRRYIFGANLAAAAFMSAVLALFGTLFRFLTHFFFDITSAYSVFYGEEYGAGVDMFSSLPMMLGGAAWNACLYLALAACGIFFGCLYYVIPKWMRVALSIAIPCLLVLGLPALAGLLPPGSLKGLVLVLNAMFGTTAASCVTCLLTAALFALLAWLAVRRAAVARNPQPSSALGTN